MNTFAYDTFGRGYATTRRTDPRIAAAIYAGLGWARSLVNVGAGAGSYEPQDRCVVAVEPSSIMIKQRPARSAPCVQAAAEALPFTDRSFDATMAVLTVHHWRDQKVGLRELMRVARHRAIVFTFDEEYLEKFWLFDYFPFIAEFDHLRLMPASELAQLLGGAVIQPVPIPWACVDGFLGAFWRRPEAYLDPDVRAGISSFRVMPSAVQEAGVRRLDDDIQSGAWSARYGEGLRADELDLGYRLLVKSLD